MKLWALLFFALPVLGCTYVGWHVWRILPLTPLWKSLVITLMTTCFVLFILNFFIGLDRMPLSVARVLYEVGNSSIFILLYLVILFLVLDMGRLLHVVPNHFLHNSMMGSLSILTIMVAVFVYGNLHYYNKVREEINLADHTVEGLHGKRIVLMSDLHLGYHNTRADLAKWIDLINAEQPDLILIAGDIVDISVHPLIEEDMATEFRRLQAPVYACLGNHDYYAGEPKSEQFYHDSGIRLLRDTCVTLPDGLTIVGRDDRTNPQRKSVREILGPTKHSFTILLDHQPYHLEEAELADIDFQFSGHTHYGQVWPISWIEDVIYEDAFGPLQKGKTRYYVSSGIGIWGGKFRIGTRSEYVVLNL